MNVKWSIKKNIIFYVISFVFLATLFNPHEGLSQQKLIKTNQEKNQPSKMSPELVSDLFICRGPFLYKGRWLPVYEHFCNWGLKNKKMMEGCLGMSIVNFWLKKHEASEVFEVGSLTSQYSLPRVKQIANLSNLCKGISGSCLLGEQDYTGKTILSGFILESFYKSKDTLSEDEAKNFITILQKILLEAQECLIIFPVGYNREIDEYVVQNTDNFGSNISVSSYVRKEEDKSFVLENNLSRIASINYGPDSTNGIIIIEKFDPQKLASQTPQNKAEQLLYLLRPMDISSFSLERYGSRGEDGGYVTVNEFCKDSIVYSFGIGTDCSWEYAVAEKNLDIFMYDHTIDQLPMDHKNFHFFKVGIADKEGYDNFGKVNTFENLIRENGHQECHNIILKIDVGGAEFDSFLATPETTLEQFSQIIVEFHQLNDLTQKKLAVLKKINKTHQIVHLHGNNCSYACNIDGIFMPNDLEVTYVRRAAHDFSVCRDFFPRKIDCPNNANNVEIQLGYCGLW